MNVVSRTGMNITAFDAFCGAGGSSTGIAAAGVEVRHAVNHWQLAIETHATNHPQTDHDVSDLSLAHPSMFPYTTIAWFSPECTNHSLAKGRKRKNLSQLDLWGQNGVDPAEERSRATMREVVEFSAYHRYEIVIVENVVDIRYWEHYDQWLTDMHNLGYEHKALYLNAMFFGVPQSRDRIYVVFWKKGNKAPNLDFRPYAFCIDHGVVGAVQSFKKAQHWGRYGKKRQYVYCCPTCGRIIEPFTRPASDVIDWSIPSTRIGDRDRPLKPKTIKRILEGLKRFAPEPALVDMAYGTNAVTQIHETLPTQTTRQTLSLINPFLISYMNQNNPPRSVDEPLYTLPTLNAIGLLTPFIAELRKDSLAREVDEPLATITAGGGHHALITPFLLAFKNTDQGEMPLLTLDDPLSTIVAGGGSQHALVTPFILNMKNSHSADGTYLLPPIALDDPLSTIVAAGSQHALITPFIIETGGAPERNSTSISAPLPTMLTRQSMSLVTPFLMAYYGNAPTFAGVNDPIPTVTAVERHALINPEALLDECGFRMLESEELKRGMSFPPTYRILGNKREQVKQIGNAVACNVAQAIVERCVAALA